MNRPSGFAVQSCGCAALILGFTSQIARAENLSGGTPTLSQYVQSAQGPSTSDTKKTPVECAFTGRIVSLRRVVVTNATRVNQAEVDAAVHSLIGPKRDIAIYCEARNRVAALYASKGYRLTRVEVTPQDIKVNGGELVLQVTEGYIAKVDTAHLDKMKPAADLARGFLAPLATADSAKPEPTSWVAFERAILLARDIPGAEIDIRLHPSKAGPGAVDLIADAGSIRRYDVSVGMDDMGSKQLGQVAGFARLDINSLTGFGDRTTLLFYGTTTGAQKAVEGLESFFIGKGGLRGNLDLSYARTEPGGELAPLGIAGDFLDGRWDFSFPLVRGGEFNLQAIAGLEIVNERNSLGALLGSPSGAPLLFRDKLRIFRLKTDYRWAPEAVESLSLTGDVELRQGFIGLDSSRVGDAVLSRASGDPAALVVRSDLVARWTFGGRPAFEQPGGGWFELAGHLQYSDQSLLAFEQFQVGNYTIGRGFDPGAASGDSAYALQASIGKPVPYISYKSGPMKGQTLWFEPYAFVDVARLENHVGYNVTVESFGFGVSARLPWRLRVAASFAEPLGPPFPGATKPAPRLLATVTRVFSFH